MRSHISAHRATTKYFSNSFVFEPKIEKEGLPGDSTPDLGAGGPEFKSRRPDQNISRVFLSLLEGPFTPIPVCGILADRSSIGVSRLVSQILQHGEYAKNTERLGKTGGTLRTFRLSFCSKTRRWVTRSILEMRS